MNSWMHLRYWSSVGLLPARRPAWPAGASASRISSAMRASRSLEGQQHEARPARHTPPTEIPGGHLHGDAAPALSSGIPTGPPYLPDLLKPDTGPKVSQSALTA